MFLFKYTSPCYCR